MDKTKDIEKANEIWDYMGRMDDDSFDSVVRKFGITTEQARKLMILRAIGPGVKDSFYQAYESMGK